MFEHIGTSKIFFYIEKLINFINSIFFVTLIIGLTFALILSPPDYLQGDNVRIMYVHVPSAWLGLAAYTCIAIFSILSFIFKIKNLDIIMKSIAPIGLTFTCLAIITGSLWGQPTWGTWWAWDARITSMLILAVFFILIILSHKLIDKTSTAIKFANVISIVGLINIPIIRYSVDWWSTLHQPTSIKISGTSTIHSSMLLPLMLMFLVLLLYCALIFLMKYKTEIIKIKKKNYKRL
ncbi:MAG: heme transporter HemC [Pelagibacteraceae bacterium]|nr:heme transporter HemC [Pelagibacteraceae bacterium]|tara:strand:+ start:6920 stop:7627 length:708 start_codon:yes stop_codon:yes gene_type:complete